MVVFQMILLSVLFSLLEMPLLISYSCLGKKSGMSTWLTSLFPSDISSFILSIPLSQFGFEDRFIWGFSKNGDFSASSAYSLLLALEHQCSSSSPGPSVHCFWPKISLGTSFGPFLFPTKFIFSYGNCVTNAYLSVIF